MRIVVAPDSFKGSLSASRAADAVAAGILRVLPDAEILLIPIADGGEGTAEALVMATDGSMKRASVLDPLGRRVNSYFGMLGDGETAVVEMAAASGLMMVPEELLNPLVTTTFGTGELIGAALDEGCRKIILAIGGSATNDAGVGALQALGGSFKDDQGMEVNFGGREVGRIRSIDLDNLAPRLKDVQITVACDVDNPLTGKHGASVVYGPQKGATPEMVGVLDAALKKFASLIKKSMNVDVNALPGSGAAGGMGAAAMVFLGAEMRPGVEIVLDANGFEERIEGADLIITGEGKVDLQTLHGKVINGVLKAAGKKGVPVLVLAGTVEPGGYELLNRGAVAVLPIVNRPMPLEEAKFRAAELLSKTTEQAMRLFIGPEGLGQPKEEVDELTESELASIRNADED